MPSDTLANLRTRVRERVNMENTTFVTDAEVTRYLNASAFELWSTMATMAPHWLAGDPYQFTLSGSNEFALSGLSDGMHKLVGVDYQSGSDWVPLRPFDWGRRGEFQTTPDANGTYRVWYVPEMTKLSADGDTLAAAIPQEMDELVVIGACIKARDKEESDASLLREEKAVLLGRLRAMAGNRGNPSTVSDDDGSMSVGVDGRALAYRLAGAKIFIYRAGMRGCVT